MENLYEAMLILDPTQSDEELSATVEQIKSIIVRADGEVVSAYPLYMRRRLSFQLGSHTEGTYVMVYFHGALAVDQLKHEIEMSTVILRSMIVRANPKALWVEGPPAPPPDRRTQPREKAAEEEPAPAEAESPAEAKSAEPEETEAAADVSAEAEAPPAEADAADAAEPAETPAAVDAAAETETTAPADAESQQEEADS